MVSDFACLFVGILLHAPVAYPEREICPVWASPSDLNSSRQRWVIYASS